MSKAIELLSIVERVARKHGGTVSKGEWCTGRFDEQPRANAFAGELRLRHFQVRSELFNAKDKKWEVSFR